MSNERPDIDALWDYSQPALSEARFAAALAALEPTDPAAAETLTQLARAQGLQRRFDQAHATLDDAQARITEQPGRAQVRYLLERGRVVNSSGDPAQARRFFDDAWNLARELGEDGLAVDAAHMLAIVAGADEALAWNLRALDLAQDSAEPRAQRWRGSLYNNIGWTYHAIGRFAEALAMFEQALDWRRSQNQPAEIRIARWCVARAQRSLGRSDEALEAQRALAAELNASEASDGYVDEEIGECLLTLGQPDAARPFFARAHAELSQDRWLAEREPERIDRLRRLAVE